MEDEQAESSGRKLWSRASLTRRIRRVFLILLTGYVVLMLSVAGCADRLLLYPSTDPIELPGESRQVIPFDSRPLELWTTRSDAALGRETEGYVLAFIGNGSRAEYEAFRLRTDWSHHAVEIWALNYPGYGQSAGRATIKAIAPSALAAYDALAIRAAGKPIFLSGHSLGTAAALHVAAHRHVGGLVIHNPPPLRQLIVGRYGWFNLWLVALPFSRLIPPDLDSLANGAKCGDTPAVFILGGRDTIVPPPFQERVFQSYAGPKQLMPLPEAGHNDAVEGEDLLKLWPKIDWLWEQATVSR